MKRYFFIIITIFITISCAFCLKNATPCNIFKNTPGFLHNNLYLSVTLKQTENANPKYLRAIDDNALLYADAECLSPVFYLTKGYYVALLEYGASYSHVACFNSKTGGTLIDGYVVTNNLLACDYTPTLPYFESTVTLTNNAVMFSDVNKNTVVKNLFTGRVLLYFGQLPTQNGSVMYYVQYGDTFGYIESIYATSPIIPDNPDELPTAETQPKPTAKKSKPNGLRVAIIVVMIIATLIVILSIFIRPKKKKLYDEE